MYVATAAVLACAAPNRPCGGGGSTCARSPGTARRSACRRGSAARCAAWWWSRILDRREVLCVINTDPVLERQAWVTVDAGLHAAGSWTCCTAADLSQVAVEGARNGWCVTGDGGVLLLSAG